MPEELKKPDPHGPPFSDFMNEFVGESDRASVILGAAKVEFLLGQILDKFLLPCTSSFDDLLEGDAPLATFNAKIKVCHRLGLIDDNFVKLLNIFRKLRNGFAHEVTTGSLSSGSSRDRVLALAEPFIAFPMFQSLLHAVAKTTKRDINDPGVIFRAVLAIFHLELGHLHAAIEGIKPAFSSGIVESCRNAIPPENDGLRGT